MVSIEQLYKDYEVLAEAKDKIKDHETEFLSILSGVHSGPGQKRLASQFIARFFKYFPNLADKAIDAQLDLCEDEDLAIRKQAIKDLPALCKDTPEHLPRIADVLVQLLQSEEPTELSLINSSLMTLFRADAKGTLKGLFEQIQNGEEVVREHAFKFLSLKFKQLPEDLLTKEVEEYMMTEFKKVLDDVTGDEFIIIMNILSSLKLCNTLQGRQQLVELVAEQAELGREFDASNPDDVDRLMQCVKQALPYFSKNVHSDRFIAYISDNVIPVISETSSGETNGEEKSDGKSSDISLEMLRLFAELSAHCGDTTEAPKKVEKIYTKLLDYMPLPPPEEEGENSHPTNEPKLHFSYVECLMYAFHQLVRHCPEFLTADENADRLKDFRLRLQYFARGIQVYIKQLRLALANKKGEELKLEENKIKVIALKLTNNINMLIKDLFHNPPSFKTVVNLSWKPVARAPGATSPSAGQKRTPITFDSSDAPKKSAKGDQKMYAPPSGKFSQKAGTYSEQGRGRGRGGYGRGGRRGSWRGQRW